MNKIIDNYLSSEQKVVGYEAWLSWYTQKGSNRIACAKLVEKDGNTFSTGRVVVDIPNVSEQCCIINDVIDTLIECYDADIITMHVSDYRVIRILKFGFVPKQLFRLVERYKELSKRMEVIFVKDKWYNRDHHNEEVDKKAKEAFENVNK